MSSLFWVRVLIQWLVLTALTIPIWLLSDVAVQGFFDTSLPFWPTFAALFAARFAYRLITVDWSE